MLSRLLVPTLAVGLLLSGCGAKPDAPTHSPVPSPMCTPEFGGNEYPCSQDEFEKMKQRDALYAEAEELNAQFREQLEVVYRNGASEEMPVALSEITDGSARVDLENLLGELREQRVTIVGGDIRQVFVERNPGSKEGSEVSLNVCVDASSTKVHLDGEAKGPGDAVLDHMFFKRVDGEMKIWANDAELVESCE